MKTSPKVMEISKALSVRFGVDLPSCDGWRELNLFGGIGMDRSTFSAITNAAIKHGDSEAIIYELETTGVDFEPVTIDLEFSSFNELKTNAVSHFDVAMVPASKSWVALLKNELETVVYGYPRFLSEVANSVPVEFLDSVTPASE